MIFEWLGLGRTLGEKDRWNLDMESPEGLLNPKNASQQPARLEVLLRKIHQEGIVGELGDPLGQPFEFSRVDQLLVPSQGAKGFVSGAFGTSDRYGQLEVPPGAIGRSAFDLFEKHRFFLSRFFLSTC